MHRTWGLGLFFIFATSFLVTYIIQEQKQASLLDARHHAITNVHYLSMDVERTLYGLHQTFRGLETLLPTIQPAGNGISTENLKSALSTLVADSPFMTSLTILDAAGRSIHWSGIDYSKEFRLTDTFAIHKNHQVDDLYIGRPVAAHNRSGAWHFGVSKGFRSDLGLQFVMVASIDLNYIYQRYRAAKRNVNSTLTISSFDGYIYSRLPEYENFVGKFSQQLVRVPNKLKQTTVLRQKDNNGENNMVVSSRVGSYPLLVTITESESSILSHWRKDTRNLIILGVVVSLVISFLTYRVSNYQKKQREIKEELRNQASTDHLTGLSNRRYALKHADHEIKKARRTGAALAFVLMDLDHFKAVNDNYGHDMGDKVLRKTANILQRICREADIVSRYGGEEFLLVLPNTDLDGALADAERIRKIMGETSYRHNKQNFVVTASFGVSQWAEHEEDYTEAMRRADKALYKVKNLGRNGVDFQETAKVTPLHSSTIQRRKND